MVDVPVNYVAVVIAAVVNMIVGFVWFGPLFGKKWVSLMKFSPQHMEDAKKKGMNKLYVIAFIGSLLMAYVLEHVLVFASAYTHTTGISAGMMVGFWNWLGFVVPVLLATVLWEGKSWKLWVLNAAYYLVALLIMGSILAYWM